MFNEIGTKNRSILGTLKSVNEQKFPNPEQVYRPLTSELYGSGVQIKQTEFTPESL